MADTTLDRDLKTFAVELFEHIGGLVEWPSEDGVGSVIVPPKLAASVSLPGEAFTVGVESAPGVWSVGLGGEFLDVASRVLDLAVPHGGLFRIGERYLTTRDLTDKISQTYDWQNARAKYRDAERQLVEYHVWTLHASLRSEDVWETVLRVAMNAESQAACPLANVIDEPDLSGGDPEPPLEQPTTYDTAMQLGRRQMIQASAEFIQRIEQRLERDRKRLHDYYAALAREADKPKRRAVLTPADEDVGAQKRAVKLELRRKLAELTENYAMQAVLRPLTLARVRIPTLVVPAMVQRKQAFREYRLYWNGVLRKFEPLACSRCRQPIYSVNFTNETVEALCTSCASAPHAVRRS